jgi:hypothetical protein
LILFFALVPQEAEPEFIGCVVVEWLKEEEPDRSIRLVEDSAFRDSEGRVARAGTRRAVPIPSPEPDAVALEDLQNWIAEEDPDLDEIDARLQEMLGGDPGAASP